MEAHEHLDHLRRESEALLAAAAVDLTRDVRSCPGWTVADLLWHVADVHHRWGRIAEGITDGSAARAVASPARPPDEELGALARREAERLIAVLAEVDPAAPRWNWSQGPQTAAWIVRRMAHETAVHRVDAEQAAGQATPIDARLAADGIDEVLTVLLPTKGDYDGRRGYVAIAETDSDRAWAVARQPPDASVVAPTRVPKRAEDREQLVDDASTVQLTLWGRAEPRGAGELTRALIHHLARR